MWKVLKKVSQVDLVNTRLAFDTEILMAKCLLKNRSSIHLNQDEDFKSYKRDDLKVIYNLKLDSDKKYEKDALLQKLENLTI